jgi:hypothetical protein
LGISEGLGGGGDGWRCVCIGIGGSGIPGTYVHRIWQVAIMMRFQTPLLIHFAFTLLVLCSGRTPCFTLLEFDSSWAVPINLSTVGRRLRTSLRCEEIIENSCSIMYLRRCKAIATKI